MLTGTAAIDVLEPALDLDQPMDLAAFNAPFAPARTEFDWLSRDDAQVDLYVADPECGFGLDDGRRAGRCSSRARAARRPGPDRRDARRTCRCTSRSGPTIRSTAALALLTPLLERYGASLHDVTTHVYAGARHEVFNETNRDEVFADLLTWLTRVAD